MFLFPCSIKVDKEYVFGNIKIRAITEHDLEFLWREKNDLFFNKEKLKFNNVFIADWNLHDYIQKSESIIEFDYKKHKKLDDLDHFLTVCRLQKKWKVLCLLWYSNDPNFKASIPIAQINHSIQRDDETITFNDKDYSETDQLYIKIKESKNFQYLYDRFNTCFTSDQKNENIFITMVSILEILIYENTKNEIAFRFELYITFLLKELWYWNVISENQTLIKRIYQIRSDIVHWWREKYKIDKWLFDFLINITSFLLKNKLLWNIDISKTKDEILQKILV